MKMWPTKRMFTRKPPCIILDQYVLVFLLTATKNYLTTEMLKKRGHSLVNEGLKEASYKSKILESFMLYNPFDDNYLFICF